MVREQEARRKSSARLTISRAARTVGLTRSTLLYYDRIGLLSPTAQSPAGYRLYGAEAIARLSRIVELRAAGMPLETIKQVLEARTPLAEALERQVGALNRRIAQLRAQQRIVLSLLQSSAAEHRVRVVSIEAWTRMFRSIGMNDEDMHRWHIRFETSMPLAHKDFLESLGLDAQEVRRIRKWSMRAQKTDS